MHRYLFLSVMLIVVVLVGCGEDYPDNLIVGAVVRSGDGSLIVTAGYESWYTGFNAGDTVEIFINGIRAHTQRIFSRQSLIEVVFHQTFPAGAFEVEVVIRDGFGQVIGSGVFTGTYHTWVEPRYN